MSDSINCPSCLSNELICNGVIQPSKFFAGRRIEKTLLGGSLYQCLTCSMFFRFPRYEPEELNALYASGASENWSDASEMREDWKLVREWLHTQQGLSRVLDVGCYDGRLLESLGPDYTLLGVELHPGARVRAEARGVQILADNFTDLSQIKAVADVTIACDVIEHSADPRLFLEGLACTVRPGGYVLVTTGNTDAWTWRLMGSRYWYCFIAEHISFINPVWVRKNKDSLGLELQQVVHFSHTHSGASLSTKVYELLANLLLRFAPKLFAFIRRRGFGGIDVKNHPDLAFSSPSWMTATDHMFLVFRKKNAG